MAKAQQGKKEKDVVAREMRSSLFVLDLNEDKL